MAVWCTLYTAKRMAKAKTTILIDKDLLDQFKRLASLKHGTTRSLSSEIEEALRAFSPFEILSSAAKRLGQRIDHYPSLREVAKNRPRVKISAATVVREMRDERERHLFGHK